MPERPVVMISSTAMDLPEHREQVRQACERAGFAPHEMMENLDALDADAIEASLEMVDKADVYIGVFAFRYGYVPDGREISVTEMEYNRAVEQEKPRLIFFMHDDHNVTPRMVETGPGAEKLAALKERAGNDRVAGFFESAADLRAMVISSLFTLKESLEGESDDSLSAAQRLHRRTIVPAPPEPYVAHPYTLSQTRDLIGRQQELNALTDWVTKPGSPAYDAAIFCLVAIGGMGKSALTWKWFRDIAPREMPNLAGRLWWSFYESDGHFENFLNRALCYVGGLSEKEVRKMAWQDRENALLRHLDEKPYLLVLDGLERILLAYNRMDASSLADDDYDAQTANAVAGAYGLPETAAQSFTGQHRLRQTTDPRAGQLLRKLAQVKKSRILISTRLYPLALQLPNRKPCPGASAYFLPGLSDDDAVALWRALGVSGSRQELVPIFQSFESHPLLVQALASEVARDRKAPGDFTAWRAANPSFDPSSLPATKVKSHILHHALAGLDEGLREVLINVVALSTPATYDTLEALLVGDGKTYGQLQELDRALTELEDRGLIGWDREANRYDAHPIVRGVAWQLAKTGDREAVYSAMEAHFEPMADAVADWRQITSLDDLAPAIERYHMLVGLGRLDDAFALFEDRLGRATHFRLAAHRERIAWLAALFSNGTDQLPALASPSRQSLALNALALSYGCSGRPGDAASLYERKLALDEQADDKGKLETGLSNLALALREVGALRAAGGRLRHALALTREREDRSNEGIRLQELGRVFSIAGATETAFLAYTRGIGALRDEGDLQAQGVGVAYLADMALRQGDDAGPLADYAWSLAAHEKVERDFIRAVLHQGRAAIASNDPDRAAERLHQTLTRARTTNLVELELPALIALAELDLKQEKPAAAKAHLDGVWDAAESGPYPLYQADAYNVLAEILRAEGDQAGAIDAAEKAYRAAWCDGPPWAYHWGLEKAKAHLQALGAPEPEMPPFDEAKFEPMPDVEINPKDDYWVDPSLTPEELLDLILRDIQREGPKSAS